jgi:uncharacterized membrane protein
MADVLPGNTENVKETGRIESFSDGVFAVAITLLVLDLQVPERTKGFTDVALLNELGMHWPDYLAFAFSFFSIFIIWVNHHKLFKQIYKRNTALMFINGFMLFLVCLVSFSSSLLARFYTSGSNNITATLYTGLFVLINLAFNLLWYQVSRDGSLLRPGTTEHTIRQIKHHYIFAFPTYLIAFVLSFFMSDLALGLSVLLWIFWAVSSAKIERGIADARSSS